MSANIVNQMPYLRTSREFPGEAEKLTLEVNKAYVDIAKVVNERTIGIFPTTRPAITGESWYLVNNQKQQTFRQVYPFTTTASITHEINLAEIYGFSRLFGQYTDGTNWYGLIPTSTVAIAGQLGFYVSPTQIVFTLGGGAPVPTLGLVILEWLSFA